MKGSNTFASHTPEQKTFPANKMLPKEIAAVNHHDRKKNKDMCKSSAKQKKVAKKNHTKRSRMFLKNQLRSEKEQIQNLDDIRRKYL
jgi:hypothetical protein